MKIAALLAAASALFASSLLVSNVSAQSMSASVPPPPGINDPGVKAAASPAPAPASQNSNPMTREPPPLPEVQGAAPGGREAQLPQIRVRQEGDNTIQEYSHSGQVYMVVVTPKHGLQQTYMVDPQGRLIDEHGKREVAPAMYKVLEWGKSKPAAEDSSQTNPDENSH
ncbi:DUF2782 domain-containing protein [Rhodanobacter koreensis]